MEVLGGFWAASGEWSRHRFQKLFTTASGFRLHEKRAPRRDENGSRCPRTFASYKVAHQPSAQRLELDLVYLIDPEGKSGSLKDRDLYDQKAAPLTPNSVIYNRHPFPKLNVNDANPSDRHCQYCVVKSALQPDHQSVNIVSVLTVGLYSRIDDFFCSAHLAINHNGCGISPNVNLAVGNDALTFQRFARGRVPSENRHP